MPTADPGERCPQCRTPLARPHSQPPWCPECEWNLANRDWDEHRRPSRSERRARMRAFELNRRGYDELRGNRPPRATATRSRRIIAVASVLLLVVDVVLLVLGADLLTTGSFAVAVVGLLLVLIAVECRPRFPRMRDEHGRLAPDDAPALFDVVERARDAVGAPRIDVLIVNDDFNAFCARVGLRRRTVLAIGLPLWAALTPPARLALLGHELGHLVNRDPTRAFTSQPALTTFQRLAVVFHPRGMTDARMGHLDWLMRPASYVVFGPLHVAFRRLDAWLRRVSARDRQRAEIYADALAVDLGGSAGAEELVRTLLFESSVRSALQRAAVAGPADPARWRSLAADARAAREANTRLTEQRSLRMEVHGHATHPPTGMRLRLLRSWPHAEPRLVIDDAVFDAADAQLAKQYAILRRALADSRVS